MDRARFVSCECGKHGRIVLADGYEGPEVCLKRQAELYVVTGIQHQRFTLDEAESVMKDIAESTLPSELDDEVVRRSWLADAWNFARGDSVALTEAKVEPSIRHAALQNKAEVPTKYHRYLQSLLSRRG